MGATYLCVNATIIQGHKNSILISNVPSGNNWRLIFPSEERETDLTKMQCHNRSDLVSTCTTVLTGQVRLGLEQNRVHGLGGPPYLEVDAERVVKAIYPRLVLRVRHPNGTHKVKRAVNLPRFLGRAGARRGRKLYPHIHCTCFVRVHFPVFGSKTLFCPQRKRGKGCQLLIGNRHGQGCCDEPKTNGSKILFL